MPLVQPCHSDRASETSAAADDLGKPRISNGILCCLSRFPTAATVVRRLLPTRSKVRQPKG